MTTTIEGRHCQQCGARIGVDEGEWEGYSTCCNERVVFSSPSDPCSEDKDCYHLEEL